MIILILLCYGCFGWECKGASDDVGSRFDVACFVFGEGGHNLRHGGAVVMAESFRTPEFWPIVRRYNVTTTGLLGSMVHFLLDQPPSPSDRDHPLKNVLVAPLDFVEVIESIGNGHRKSAAR